MDLDTFTASACLIALIGIICGMILIAYEDSIPQGRWKKVRCKVGWHKLYIKIGKLRISKYYCQFCKKPRKYPDLKSIDGGSKLGNNKFRF